MQRHTLVLTAALACAAAPAAAHDETGPGHAMEERHERLAQLLDLSADQEMAWSRLRAERLSAARERMEAAQRARDRIHELADADRPDLEEIGRAVVEARRRMAEAAATSERYEAAVADLLTPEQRLRWDTLRQAREQLREGRHERRGRRARGRFRAHRRP